MAKRIIGIDIDRTQVHIVVLSGEKGNWSLQSAERRPCNSPEDPVNALREVLEGDPVFGDHLLAALPARDGFVRRLKFPFADLKKIEPTITFEMSAQLPIAVEDCIVDFQSPAASGNEYLVTVGAVPAEAIQKFLQPFDEAGLPLQTLDLAPFGFGYLLSSETDDAILAVLREQETTVALVRGGGIAEHRTLPSLMNRPPEQRLAALSREYTALRKETRGKALPFYLIGTGADPDLVDALRDRDIPVKIPVLPLGDNLAPEFLPAAALAWRGTKEGKTRLLNFRKGPYTLKSEWTNLKKRLVLAMVLLGCTILAVGASAYLNYSQRASRAEALKKEMEVVFRKTFPEARTVIDVPLQMRSKLTELRKKGRLLGAGDQASPLTLLQDISQRVPESLTVDIREFIYSPETIRLEGATSSFDAINQLSTSLVRSKYISDAQIADAKMSLDGSRVDFRLNLTLATEGGAP